MGMPSPQGSLEVCHSWACPHHRAHWRCVTHGHALTTGLTGGVSLMGMPSPQGSLEVCHSWACPHHRAHWRCVTHGHALTTGLTGGVGMPVPDLSGCGQGWNPLITLTRHSHQALGNLLCMTAHLNVRVEVYVTYSIRPPHLNTVCMEVWPPVYDRHTSTQSVWRSVGSHILVIPKIYLWIFMGIPEDHLD